MSTNEARGDFGKNWNDKLRLLDAIDAMRESTANSTATPIPPEENTPTVMKLQEKLHVYEQTCAMLEHEVQILEQQTISALAEANRLRYELSRTSAQKNNAYGSDFLDHIEKDRIRKIIDDSENERRLLLDALENSEAELARMVKTLDMVARKLQVA